MASALFILNHIRCLSNEESLQNSLITQTAVAVNTEQRGKLTFSLGTEAVLLQDLLVVHHNDGVAKDVVPEVDLFYCPFKCLALTIMLFLKQSA